MITEHTKQVLAANGLRFETREGRGRCMVADRAFEAGEVLLRCEPYAVVPQWGLRDSLCDWCLKRGTPEAPLKRCAACHGAAYCSRECQTLAWKAHHKRECKLDDTALAAALPDTTLDEIRLACRILWRREAEVTTTTTTTTANGNSSNNKAGGLTYEDVFLLVSHYAEIQRKDPARLAAAQQVAGLVLRRCGLRSHAGATQEHVAELLCRMQNNDFGVWDGAIFSIGAGVFPDGALVNHSCAPSSVITYETAGHAATQVFRCTRALRPGDEVTHCYMDLASTSAARNEEFATHYMFTCTCPRCVPPPVELDAALAALSPAGRALPQAELQTNLAAAERLDDEGCDLRREPAECIEILRRAHAIRRAYLGPLNLKLMSSAAHLMSAYLETEQWGPAVGLAEHVLTVYRAVYEHVHPMLGLHLYTLGDLYSQTGQREKARRAYEEALEILSITHGPESDLAVGLKKILAGKVIHN